MSIRAFVAISAALVLAAASPSAAGKVVRFLSPTSDTIWLKGGATGLTWDAGTTVFLATAADGWLGYTFPDSASTPVGNYGFTTRDYSTQYQLNVDFSKGDTAWVFSDPFPSGTARAVYSHPRTKVVMFWNPWEYDSAGRPPRMQLEGGAWNPMTASSSMPGWYVYNVRGFASLILAFSDSANKRYVGSLWGLPATFTVDPSIVEGTDTVWVRPTPESSGGLVATARRPSPKVVMVFNPWDGHLPIHRPRISFGGDASLPMVSSGVCGWYSFDFFERAATVLFSDDHGGQTFGASGLGSSASIDLSTAFSSHDTGWVARDATSGLAKVKSSFSGEKGRCEKVLLAATIRDFPSDGSNREFAPGRGCQRGNWAGIKGMVSPYLDAMRKPIRSPYDTGWNGIRTSWGGYEYGFRCTFDTLPGLQAEIGDTGIATTWFRTVPGRNAETCRDIPLVTDSVTGDYVYDNQQYFPIDDFDKLADGSKNPHYDGIKGSDGKVHNYSFCLESHGEFEYRKGQIFDFRGDDDVWFFIGGRLVVDLGGIHGPWADSVLLDSINAIKTSLRDANGQIVYTKTGKDSMVYTSTDSSLVEGKTYDFDFFFCERNPLGSSMRIRTDMNLRTLSGFQMRDTLRADGSRTYDMWVSRTFGQGCAARGEVVRTVADKIRLSGPSATPPLDLAGGVHYGGIAVAADLGSFTIDTSKIVGLAPGRYEIAVVSSADASDVRRAVFVVPWTAEPRFVAKTPYSGSVGSSFPVDIASFNEAGPDSSSVVFQLRSTPGLRWFLDSALTRPVPADSVLRTPRDHVPLRLWVRGDSAGTYALVVGRSALDSTDEWSGIEFLDKGLRFVDSLGRTVAANAPVVRDVGDTVRVHIEAYNGNARCASCADSIALAPSFPGLVFLDTTGRSVVGIRLEGGEGSFLVVGVAPVESASVVVASVEMGKRIVRSPFSFRSRALRWIDASGQELTSIVSDTAIFSVVGPLRLEVRGVDGPCGTCAQWVALSATRPGVSFLDSATGRPVDSIRLSGGRATVRITATRAVDAASLVACASSLDSAVLSAFTFRAHAPDSGAWFDDDGDGAADRATIVLRHPWTASTALQVAWPGASSYSSVEASALSLSTDSLVVTYRPTIPLPGTATASESLLGRWSRDGGAWMVFPMRDRIAPVVSSARLRWGDKIDTLRLLPSEPLAVLPATSTIALLVAVRGAVGALPLSASLDPATGEVVLLYAGGTSPLPGDSVRFAMEGVSDTLGNRPGSSSRKVAIQGTDRPPRDAIMLDRDGDGRADRVVLRFATRPTKTSGYRFRWGAAGNALEERVVGSLPTDSDSNGLVLGYDLAPFAAGATSCPTPGCIDLGVMLSVDGSDTITTNFGMRDGVAPVLARARLRYASEEGPPDTLLVEFSETVAVADASHWISWNSPVEVPAERAVSAEVSTLSSDGRSGVLFVRVDSAFWPLSGDLARMAGSGGLVDGSGSAPGAVSPWVPIELGPRPLRIDAKAFPPIRRIGSDGDPRPGEPPLRILVRNPSMGSWASVDGDAAGDTSRFSGILLSLNAPISGDLFVYDNLGTHVGSISLAPLARLLTSPEVVAYQDGEGCVHAWIAWNGGSATGKRVADGVYTIRLVGFVEGRGRAVINRLFLVGRKRAP